MSIDPSAVAELAAAVGGGGLVVGLVDRWRYRGRPKLDIAELAQRLAAEALGHARTEIQRAWDEVHRYEAQVDALRSEVAELRTRVERREAAAAELRATLAATQAELAERTAERDQLRDALARIAGSAPAPGRAGNGGTDAV